MNKKLLLTEPKEIRYLTFGGKLTDCRNSLEEALNQQENMLLSIRWYTDDPYNAGQAVTLLEVSGYSFDVWHDNGDSGYQFKIMTSFREDAHFIEISPIKQSLERVRFEQGRYDALMELLDKKN